MLVKLARNWFSPRGELFYVSRNPNVVDDDLHDALPADAVVVEGPDRPKPDTTKPDVVNNAPQPDLVRAVGAALKDETTARQVDQLAEAKEREAAALDAASKAPEPTPIVLPPEDEDEAPAKLETASIPPDKEPKGKK